MPSGRKTRPTRTAVAPRGRTTGRSRLPQRTASGTGSRSKGGRRPLVAPATEKGANGTAPVPSNIPFGNLLPALTTILADGGYLSHCTALYLLGLSPTPPDRITIVCGTRRRHREIEGWPVQFVYHKAERLGPMQTLTADKLEFPVSTLEKTLIDLVLDLEYAPGLPELATLFAVLPYRCETLFALAEDTSDTVFKRILCLATLAGRAPLPNDLAQRLTRTPVLLDAREKTTDLTWESRLHLKVPATLANWIPPAPPSGCDSETREWMALRAYPPFAQLLLVTHRLPLRPTLTEAEWESLLDGFFTTHLDRDFSDEQLADLFTEHLPGPRPAEGSVRRYPEAFHRWLDRHTARWQALVPRILPWIKHHLNSPRPDRLAHAIELAMVAGLEKEALEAANRCALELFDAGHHRMLRETIETLAARGHNMPHYTSIILHRIHAAAGKPELARTVLEQAIARHERETVAPLASGDLHHAMGMLLASMRRTDEALAEYYVAQACFEEARDRPRQGMVAAAMGNLYFALGQTTDAKHHYLRSLALFHGSAANTRARASLLHNLGLIDSYIGRLRQSDRFLSRACTLFHNDKRRFQESNALVQLGMIRLLQGHYTKAMTCFQQGFRARQGMGTDLDNAEAIAFIAYTYELLGSHANALTWWRRIRDNDLHETKPRTGLQVLLLKAMTDLILGQPKHACERLQTSIERMRALRASNRELGLALTYLGLAQVASGNARVGIETLHEAERLTETVPRDLNLWRLRCILAAVDRRPEVLEKYRTGLREYMACHAFDPFWPFYAAPLTATGHGDELRFVLDQLNRTPPPTLALMRSSVPGFGKMVRTLRQKSSRAAEFYNHLRPGSIEVIHRDDYPTWAAQASSSGKFVFDGPSGVIRIGASCASIRPNSLPHQVLVQLLQSCPDAIDLEALFRTVWGTSFDPECDESAIKSTLQRLRRRLRAIHREVRIRQGTTAKGRRMLRLVIPVPWEAVV